MLNVIFWLTYFCAVIAAWFSTFQVFSQSDPWYVALLAATAIDGALAYLLYLVGRTHKNQRAAGLAAIVAFAVISGFSQVIHRYYQLGVELPAWLAWVSLALVPLATTGSVVILGAVKALDLNNDGRITRDEIRSVLDRNKDGRLSFEDLTYRGQNKPQEVQKDKGLRGPDAVARFTNDVSMAPVIHPASANGLPPAGHDPLRQKNPKEQDFYK